MFKRLIMRKNLTPTAACSYSSYTSQGNVLLSTSCCIFALKCKQSKYMNFADLIVMPFPVFNDLNETVKNSTKSLDDLLNNAAAEQPVNSKTTPKPLGTKQDDLPKIPPPKGNAVKQNTKVKVPPPKPNILLMNGDTTGIVWSTIVFQGGTVN